MAADFSAQASLALIDYNYSAAAEGKGTVFSFNFTNGFISVNYSPNRLFLMETDGAEQQKAIALVVEPMYLFTSNFLRFKIRHYCGYGLSNFLTINSNIMRFVSKNALSECRGADFFDIRAKL